MTAITYFAVFKMGGGLCFVDFSTGPKLSNTAHIATICPHSNNTTYFLIYHLNYICLGTVAYGCLTWPIQLVYLTYVHDLSTKSM